MSKVNVKLLAFSLVHPSAIIQGDWAMEPFQVLFLQRVAHFLRHGTYPIYDPTKPPPGAIYQPTWQQLWDWKAGIDRDWGITCDIENAGNILTRIGFARVHDEVPIVLRFRVQGGDITCQTKELRSRAKWCADILADPTIPLIFHNGQTHDVPELERMGFAVEGYAADTIMMQNTAYPEAPKALEFCGIAFGAMNRWKYLVGDDEGEGK